MENLLKNNNKEKKSIMDTALVSESEFEARILTTSTSLVSPVAIIFVGVITIR